MNQTVLCDRVMVHEDFRGKGLGRTFYNHAACIARAQGKKYIVTATSSENIAMKIILRKRFKEYAQIEIGSHKMVIFFARVEDILK